MNTPWLKATWLKVREYAKTVAVFLVGVAVNAVLNLINGSVPWPQTSEQWWQFTLTTFGPALATLLTRNKITQEQLDKDRNVYGGVVVPDEKIAEATRGTETEKTSITVTNMGGGGGGGNAGGLIVQPVTPPTPGSYRPPYG